jgi:uncharacterized protein with PIN domain
LKPRYKIIVYCSSCGFKFYVVVYSRIPIPPRIARVVEKLRTCPKCGKQLGNPRVVLGW